MRHGQLVRSRVPVYDARIRRRATAPPLTVKAPASRLTQPDCVTVYVPHYAAFNAPVDDLCTWPRKWVAAAGEGINSESLLVQSTSWSN